jgi:REP element-mobilizing transposase RayT
MPLRRPRRHPGFDYRGPHAYFLTICTFGRRRIFEDAPFAREAVVLLLQSASTHCFAIPAYCLMPDHVHFVAVGEADHSYLPTFIKSWNTQTGFAWRHRGDSSDHVPGGGDKPLGLSIRAQGGGDKPLRGGDKPLGLSIAHRPKPLWQPGYYDQVLHEGEPILGVARYVVMNPVRAGLVADPRDYEFTGSTLYTIEQILEAADDWRPLW